MTRSVPTLIDQLVDPATRDAAQAQLVAAGESSVEPLLAAFHPGDDRVRRRIIVQVLAAFDDPRVDDLLVAALTDDEEELRATAAAALRQRGAASALQASLDTINDAPDPLHYDVTPSVLALAQLGLPVLESIFPLLDASDPRTRQHAQKVLELVTFNASVAAVKPSPLSDVAGRQWADLWNSNGPYRWDADEPQRKAALERWAHWLRNH